MRSAALSILDRHLGSLYTGYQLHVTQGAAVRIDAAAGMAAPDTPMTRDTPCYWSSATKCVVALALGQLWEAGRLSLDVTLADALPELRFKDPIVGHARLRDALTYRVPVPTWLDPVGHADDENLLAAIESLQTEPTTRERSWYGLWPWVLAALLIERVSGTDLGSHLREHVLKPLGMTRSSYGAPPGARAAPMGMDELPDLRRGSTVTHAGGSNSCWGPMADLGRVYRCLLNGGTLDGVRLIGEPTATALTSRVRVGYPECHGGIVDYGIGFEIESNWHPVNTSISFSPDCGRRVFGHKGYSSVVVLADPEKEMSMSMFANADRKDVDGRAVGAVYRTVVSAVLSDLAAWGEAS
ncbi:hypothetical protein GCM10009557_17980 [Virgisporangium ochraceum]|uniref:Beta-lactamase-related domain-containing protein n=1 Tax=Virgisporangium ochraceum TaxID=65505 RepID=A0A8J4A3J5_9ACTN|nr:serine hydrolase domain-containing protein [Virgisporangium ochraceum]GIJ72695.1 hypothetical protein Voc01_076120 [Virgisporangium ochraceum]